MVEFYNTPEGEDWPDAHGTPSPAEDYETVEDDDHYLSSPIPNSPEHEELIKSLPNPNEES